jgi:outer membrane receptor protein involved in Fe transport
MRLKNQLLICTGLATFMASPAIAQAAFGPQPAATSIDARTSTNDIETAQIEDIVVTARKRAERLQDVPAAINAFDRA